MTNHDNQPATEPERVHPVIQVDNGRLRAFTIYKAGDEPYDMQDTLGQKLWAVCNHEFGPNAADVLVIKLQHAVQDHIERAGGA